jgi:transposase
MITSPKDIPYGLGRILVRWHKTRWRCREDYCERGSFAEGIAQVPARSRTTVWLRTAIGAAIGDAARSVSEVADSHAVSWPTAHRAFVAHAEALLAEPQPTPLLGIDETRRGNPGGGGAPKPGGGCGSTHGTPGSSTWLASTGYSGNARAAPVPR